MVISGVSSADSPIAGWFILENGWFILEKCMVFICLYGKSKLTWMILECPHFRKPPFDEF
jgi:hypothetical protein